MEIYTTNSAAETKDLAKRLVSTIKAGDTLLLFGELGAGKTTFTQGLAETLNVRERVTSPTFVFHKIYTGNILTKPVKINHIDCYRIEVESDANSIGLAEVLSNKNNITIIEWPERIKNLWPMNAVKIYFQLDPNDENKRIIKI